eukprot:3822079-Prorocentrum_lima.AAC.1
MFARGEVTTKASPPLPSADAPSSAPRRDRSRTPARSPGPQSVPEPGSRALSRGGVTNHALPHPSPPKAPVPLL